MRGIVVMNKKYPAYVLLILNLILQIASCFWYRELPGFVWMLASAIVILIPLLFGLRMGLLGLLPVAASELVWFHKLGNVDPLLNLVAFAMAVILMAVAHQRLAKLQRRNRAVLSGLVYYSLRGEGTAVPGFAGAGSAEISKLGHFFRSGLFTGDSGCSDNACGFR